MSNTRHSPLSVMGRAVTVGPAVHSRRRPGIRSLIGRAAFGGLAGLCLAAAAVSAVAATTKWHSDLASAARASATSRKPVLVIFTAAWSPSCEQFVQKTLPTAEVEAILDACYEPVRLDVDAAAAVAKEHGVAQLPTACVLDASGRLLARFECPEQPAGFVRLAASAARETSVVSAESPATPAELLVSESAMPVPPSAGAGFPVSTASAAVPPAVATPPSVAQTLAPAESAPQTATAFASRPTTSAFTAVSPQAASGLPVGQTSSAFSAPAGPAASASSDPAGPPTAFGGSAFTSRPEANVPPSQPGGGLAASGFQQRPFVEPAATPTAQPSPSAAAPWLGSPPAAQPAAAPPQPAPGAGVATYSGFPGYSTVAPPANGGPAATVPPPSPTPSTTASAPPATEAEKSKENPVVSFFRKPFAGLESWGSRNGASVAKSGSEQKDPIVKPAQQAVAAAPAAGGPSAAVPAGMPLGLEGYCPVTLKDKAAWVEGRTQYGACHRGRTYLFAGESEQRTFLANPDLYAPALSGDDPVMAFDAGRQVPGQRQYGVTYQARVYLFSSPETQAVFTASPERYVGRVVVAENPTSAGGTLR